MMNICKDCLRSISTRLDLDGLISFFIALVVIILADKSIITSTIIYYDVIKITL